MGKVQTIFLAVSVSATLLPLITGLKNWKTLLWMYIFIGFSFDIALILLKFVAKVNVTPLANIYVLIEFAILNFYFSHTIPTAKKIILSTAGLIASAYIFQLVSQGIYTRYGSYSALFALDYIILSLFGFYTILKQHKHTHIERSTFFWVNVALLVGFSGKFLVFLFEDYLNAHYKHLWEGIWYLFNVINVIVNILFAVALTRKDE